MKKRVKNIILSIFLSTVLVSCENTKSVIEEKNFIDVEINGVILSVKYLSQEDEATRLYGEPNPYASSVEQLKNKDLVGYPSSFCEILDEQAVIRVTTSVLAEIYGIDCIKKEQPFQVGFNKNANVWIVVGSLPAGTRGGVAAIAIEKSTGEIIMITHGK